ncbi:MAG: NAD(P)H oxidoreductase [Mycobacteriaceae bacterium]|nr:NAD(P)H oxidoreductase [Mycobacteriaceae bacterium]
MTLDTARTALVVVAHHRADSLTAHMARLATGRLAAAGYQVDVLDLRAEGFDPRMTAADQPDWDDRDKRYSDEVHAHMARMSAADVVIAVFPVYWVGPPALLKGWIDRVWNYGFGYGRSTARLAGKRMLWLGLAGAASDDPIVREMQQALENQLSQGIATYCGFAESSVRLLLDVEGQPQRIDAQGNLVIDDALVGGAREAHYADLDRRAAEFVDAFAAPVPA